MNHYPLMPNWTNDDLRAYQLERGSADRTPSGPKPKPIVQNEPLATAQGEASDAGRVSLSVRSYRRRLIDPDNLVGKYFVDACRYSRLIGEDTAKAITYQISQVKVATKDEERTEIEIVKL